MFSRLQWLVAGDSRERIQNQHGLDLWHILVDSGFAERNSVQNVGFLSPKENDSLLVVLPKAFGHPAAQEKLSDISYQKEQIYRLFRVFRKLRSQTDLAVSIENRNQSSTRTEDTTDPVLDSFDAALKLSSDYRLNGIYRRQRQREFNDRYDLAIDWRRTLTKAPALIDDQGPFIPSIISRGATPNDSHPIVLLQKACLLEIFQLFGERVDFEYPRELLVHVLRRLRTDATGTLRRIQATTFDERGRSLLRMVRSYIGNSRLLMNSAGPQGGVLAYSKDFENVWERILRDVLNSSDENRLPQQGEWYAWPDSSRNKGIQPQFDVRIENGHDEVLLDAKDYRVISGASWQGSSSDYYKQIVYRQLITTRPSMSVVNILAFPSIGQGRLFQLRGVHRWKGITDSSVYEVSVDYDMAVKHWLRDTTVDVTAEMSKLIAVANAFAAAIDSGSATAAHAE